MELIRESSFSFFEKKTAKIVQEFCSCYLKEISLDQKKGKELICKWLALVEQQLKQPYTFALYHQAIRTPFDYYQFGLDFIAPLVDFKNSHLMGKKQLKSIEAQLQKKENVVLLANHQTEPDPQIISLFLEKKHPVLAQKMIFIAGHRVITDPLAIPMSLGRNLICIYSKKHLSFSVEQKAAKIAHNQRALKQLQLLLSEGSCCIYVAPSGGRDRADPLGKPILSSFDPDSVELFRLIAKQCQRLTHFYPLALKTFDLMPPPAKVEKEIGEERLVSYAPVSLFFGSEIDFNQIPHVEKEKHLSRLQRAKYIGDLVEEYYKKLSLL